MVNWSKLRYATKVLIFVAAILLLVISIFNFISLSLNIRIIAQRIGFILFSVKLIVCELNWEPALRNFPYMRYDLGKALFILFCGTLLLTKDFGVQLIIGLVMIGISILLLILALVTRKKNESFTYGK